LRRILVPALFISLLATSLGPGLAAHADALSDANAQLAQLRQKVAAEQARLQALKNQASAEQAMVAQLGTEIVSIQGSIVQAQADMAQTQNLIATTQSQIGLTQQQLQEAIAKVQREKALLDEKTALMNDRIKFIYESAKNNDWVANLLSSVSFFDFIGRLTLFQDVSRGDHLLVLDITTTKAQLEQDRNAVKGTLDHLNLQNQQLQAQQQLFQQQENQYQLLEAQLIQQQATHDAAAAQYQGDAAAVASQIAQDEQSESQVAAVISSLQAAAAAAGYSSDGRFMWPVGGPANVTSGYGPRVDPFDPNQMGFHYGIDIATFCGDHVKAAGAGIVSLGWDPYGYGNYAIITHGSGFSTLYGHMSGFAVADGANVAQGDVIGYEGSTGSSTGCHVHFEVHDMSVTTNHGTVNPLLHLA
jgi:murein DD-endopeptidase MepM/ murein hydrolase activator NlpD